jgi:DNA-binding phage protein
MGKTATSKKQKGSAPKSLRVYEPFASKELKAAKLVSEALLDCIKSGDIESFREVLVAHLMTANKAKIARKAGIGRRTLYDLIDSKKDFNPGLSTIAAVIRALAA